MRRAVACTISQRRLGLIVVALCFAHAVDAFGASQKAEETKDESARQAINISTLNWPPYTADHLPQGGAATAVVRAALATQGYGVEVRFWPWKRAIAKARYGDEDIVAYFPGYHCRHDPNGDFLRSDALGATPLGFAEHADAPHDWETLDDLTGKRIGTVVGYANTEAFDQRVEAGIQRVITSSDDVSNLTKLANQEIDLAAIDRFVMAYTLSTSGKLRPYRDALRFNDHLLGETDLYLCFRNDAEGEALRDMFNAGLKEIDAEKLLTDYVERLVAQ